MIDPRPDLPKKSGQQVIPVLDIRHGNAVRAVAGPKGFIMAHFEASCTIALTQSRWLASVVDTWGFPTFTLPTSTPFSAKSTSQRLFREFRGFGLTLWSTPESANPATSPLLIEAGVERINRRPGNRPRTRGARGDRGRGRADRIVFQPRPRSRSADDRTPEPSGGRIERI